MLVFVLGIEFAAIGALDVVTVVVALAVLDLGAGRLRATSTRASALGGVVAILCHGDVRGRQRLIPWLVAAAAAWGAAFLVLGLRANRERPSCCSSWPASATWSSTSPAGRSSSARPPPDVVSRVFGVLEGVSMLGLAVGSLLVPVLVAAARHEGGRGRNRRRAAHRAPALRQAAASRSTRTPTVPVVEIALLRSRRRSCSRCRRPSSRAWRASLVPVDAAAGRGADRRGRRRRPLLRDRRGRGGRAWTAGRVAAAARPRRRLRRDRAAPGRAADGHLHRGRPRRRSTHSSASRSSPR